MKNPAEAAKRQEIGQRLRKLREEAGLSLSQVEQMSRGVVTKARLVSYELGRSAPKHATLISLARFYGVTPGFILEGPGPEQTQLTRMASEYPELGRMLRALSDMPAERISYVVKLWEAVFKVVRAH